MSTRGAFFCLNPLFIQEKKKSPSCGFFHSQGRRRWNLLPGFFWGDLKVFFLFFVCLFFEPLSIFRPA